MPFTRTLDAAEITAAVAQLCGQAARVAPPALRAAVDAAVAREASPGGQDVLRRLSENYAASEATGLPMCQDTGVAILLVELGQELYVEGDLEAALHAGVARGYTEHYLRTSIVRHPLRRVNTGDNTPAVLHIRVVPGDRLKLMLLPKGGGSENASALKMLKPSDGAAGVGEFVVERISAEGVNACPPLVIGVGIGGNFDTVAFLAKEALLRPLGTPNLDPDDAALEADLLARVNALGIGPAGFGGTVTALAVHVATAPCHIASLPCAVTLQCNAFRRAEVAL
jgi:fumarate hydratase subunit alpha